MYRNHLIFRHAIAAFFLSVFISNILLGSVFFVLSVVKIKNEMAAKISGFHSLSGTTMISFPLNEYKNDDPDELVVAGRLYDVVKKEIKGDRVCFYVINDHKEEELISRINAHFQVDPCDIGQNGHFIKSVKNSALDFIPKPFNDDGAPGCLAWKQVDAAFPGNRRAQSVWHAVPTPPPWQILSCRYYSI